MPKISSIQKEFLERRENRGRHECGGFVWETEESGAAEPEGKPPLSGRGGRGWLRAISDRRADWTGVLLLAVRGASGNPRSKTGPPADAKWW